ncbi:MAG: WYL domain-containing protein [Anaerolineae bacterium]
MQLLLRLMRAPAHTDQLLDLVRQHSEDDEDVSEKALRKRFENDRQRLREWFGCELTYDHRSGTYHLNRMDYPLIDLPSDAARGLAFLQATFTQNTPMQAEIKALSDQIMMVLPEERRREVARERTVQLDLATKDQDAIDPSVRAAVEQATFEHRLLEFWYHSPQQDDQKPRRHKVEPMRFFYDPIWKHYYLEAYCLETYSEAFGTVIKPDVRRYRLGRMREVKLLPQKFAPGRSLPRYELVYELAPYLARQGLTLHFPDSVVTTFDDGSVEIRAISNNLFFDVRTLLHYGAGCKITGGREAINQVKKLVNELTMLYSRSEEQDIS